MKFPIIQDEHFFTRQNMEDAGSVIFYCDEK